VSKAKGPALAVGAAAVGVAGTVVAAVALKNRRPRRKVLGVALPRNMPKPKAPSLPKRPSMPKPPSLPDMDAKSVKKVAKKVGKASESVGKKSKSVSKDIERFGEQAERVGAILK
jgi:hypothetical protein